MRLKALWSDLLLLLAVLRHPVRQWTAWRDLAGLLGDGGVTIDTPPAPEGHPIGARTVIQADGDVLVIVAEATLRDDVLLCEHARRVDEWYERSRGAVARGALALRALIATVSTAISAPGGWSTFRRLGGLAGVLGGAFAFLTLLVLVGWLLGRLASVLLRRRMKGWLGGGGLPA